MGLLLNSVQLLRSYEANPKLNIRELLDRSNYFHLLQDASYPPFKGYIEKSIQEREELKSEILIKHT